MNITEVRNVVRQAIAEAMEKGGLPKSGGKLVHLKKELQSLKGMREALGQYQIAESGESAGFVAEYAHMQKFVNELEKIKAAHAKLAEMLDNQISEVEGKVSSETEKIKEMMGLIEKAKKEPKEKKEKKTAHEKGESKAEEKEEHKPKADDKKKSKELDEANLGHNEISSIHQEGRFWIVTYRTADGKKEKSFESEKEARKFYNSLDEARFEKGEDVGKPGKGFAKIAKSAAKQYGSKEAGQKVAGAILKKVVAKGK